MTLLSKVKTANRITTKDTGINDELIDLINAALSDLKLAGIDIKQATHETEGSDPLITRAVNLYTKAHFGFDNPEAERFAMAYQKLKEHLSLSEEYRKESVN